MSDTHAQTVSYVRETMVGEKAPPVGQTGAIKWVRENLLSSWLNILLTVVSVAVLYWIATHLILPRMFNMIWNAGSLSECRQVFVANSHDLEYVDGICWAVIRDRWVQLMMGSYPPQYYWRCFVALILLFVGLAPILFPERAPKALLLITATFPFVMPWLIWGGAVWIPVLYAAGFVVGYFAFRFGTSLLSPLAGIIGAIVLSLVWWLYAVPAISDGLHRVIAESRMEATRAENAEQVEALDASIAALEEDQAVIGASITEAVDAKNALYEEIFAERVRRALLEDMPEVTELLEAAQDSGHGEAVALMRDVRDILDPYGNVTIPEVSDLRDGSRGSAPLGDAPETGDALSEEAAAKISDMIALAEGLEAGANQSGISDGELDALVADFNAQVQSLTDQREQALAVGSDIFRQDQQRALSRNLVRNIDRREVTQAGLPAQREDAAAARAGLPELVANIRTIPEDASLLDPAITDDDLDALQAVLRLEEDLRKDEASISGTYEEVGRIGLAPVGSEQLGGFQLSLIIGVTGILMSLPLGILLALGRQSNMPILKYSCVVFIEVIRGVPLIVWLMVANFLLNFFLPPGTEFDKVLRVIIMVTFFSAAYIAEVVRGGLAALPRGQYEAADALGLDYWKSMRLIVLPQALKISIPGIVNTFIGLFKDTTLVIFIGLVDALGIINQIRSDTDWNGIYWELFIFVGLVFFVFCFSMGRYSLFLERKLQREHR